MQQQYGVGLVLSLCGHGPDGHFFSSAVQRSHEEPSDRKITKIKLFIQLKEILVQENLRLLQSLKTNCL